MEIRLQAEIIKWLRDRDVYVIKTRPGPGMPVGCPDVFGFYGANWLALEVKASAKAPWRPGQEATIKRLVNWGKYVWKVYPENWPEIKELLLRSFF
jgi:Holliday junction resolvase